MIQMIKLLRSQQPGKVSKSKSHAVLTCLRGRSQFGLHVRCSQSQNHLKHRNVAASSNSALLLISVDPMSRHYSILNRLTPANQVPLLKNNISWTGSTIPLLERLLALRTLTVEALK